MLLWLWIKAFQQAIRLEEGIVSGAQKNNMAADLYQNMMILGVGPKASDPYPTQLPLKTSFLLLITQCGPRWRCCIAGWLAGWVGGVAWLAGWRG